MTVETNLNTIVPACVMEQIHAVIKAEKDRIAEEARKAEEERQRRLSMLILNSPLIPAINKSLAEYGWCRLTIGNIYNNIDRHDIDFDSWHSCLEGLSSRFIFDFLVEQYRQAGYQIGGWGTYSRNYYKEEERIIYANANCDTCEL